MKRVWIPLPDGEISVWVDNAARHFGISREQFCMIVLQDAWEKLYGKTFTWKEFTLTRREKSEENGTGEIRWEN